MDTYPGTFGVAPKRKEVAPKGKGGIPKTKGVSPIRKGGSLFSHPIIPKKLMQMSIRSGFSQK